MQWQRVVELHSAERGDHGSGYLLAPTLALTAHHCIEGLQTIDLRPLQADAHGLPGDVGPWQAARIVWFSSEHDLALLAPGEKRAKFACDGGATTFGRLDIRAAAAVRVHALGFPQAMEKPTHSDTLMVAARVNALTGIRAGSLVLDVEGTRPASGEDWKGISGAAVFAGDRLVAVIKAVPPKLDESALLAAPAHPMFDHPAAMALLRDAGLGLDTRFVDAAYVDALPPVGHWRGLREEYTRAVIESLCSIDGLGLAVTGAPERRIPALAAFTAQRLRLWPDQTPASR